MLNISPMFLLIVVVAVVFFALLGYSWDLSERLNESEQENAVLETKLKERRKR